MSDPATRNVTSDIQQIIDSAARLGIELDENDTVEWLAAMALSSISVVGNAHRLRNAEL